MKKLFLLALSFAVVVWMAFMAIMPAAPRNGECANFHPHEDEFGSSQVVLDVLDWLVRTGNFNAWTDGAKTVVSFKFNSQAGFITYGTGNPTMFLPRRGADYVKDNTQGMKKVTSQEGLNSVKGHLSGCLRKSYAESFASVPATQPASVPIKVDFAMIGTLGFLGLGGLFILSRVLGAGNRMETC